MPKPDARAYLAACQRLGVTPQDALMVGDSWQNDVQGALNAGLQAVWLNRNGAEREGVPTISHLNDLLSLLT